MKQRSISMLVATIAAGILNCIAMAQQTPSTVPSTAPAVRANTAIIPKLNAGFMPRHLEFVPIAQKGDIDVLFMGDSITDFWRNDANTFANRRPATAAASSTRPARAPASQPAGAYVGKPVFDKYFGSWKVANFGIAGDTTQGVLWRLQNGEGQGYKPKAIMLMIGTNNLNRNTPTEIAIGDAAIVYELRKDFPDAKILLLGVFPRGPADGTARTQIADINRIISTLNDAQHVFYMDIGPKFLAEDGSIPRDIMSDGLHPTTKGYEIWAEAVKEPLENLMK
jgi:lysophospholipase L1-like esterase